LRRLNEPSVQKEGSGYYLVPCRLDPLGDG
jgi:hypothetical protein